MAASRRYASPPTSDREQTLIFTRVDVAEEEEGGAGDRRPRPDTRTDKANIVRKSDKFEHYYNSLGLVAQRRQG